MAFVLAIWFPEVISDVYTSRLCDSIVFYNKLVNVKLVHMHFEHRKSPLGRQPLAPKTRNCKFKNSSIGSIEIVFSKVNAENLDLERDFYIEKYRTPGYIFTSLNCENKIEIKSNKSWCIVGLPVVRRITQSRIKLT